jgi:hypothetical protein
MKIFNLLFLIALVCFSCSNAEKLRNRLRSSTEIAQSLNLDTNSNISYDSKLSKVERIDVKISCSQGALTGFQNVMNSSSYGSGKLTHSFKYACGRAGSTADIMNQNGKATQGTSAFNVMMTVPKKDKSGKTSQPIGNSCTCPQGQVMASLEFYTESSQKNHLGLRCVCKPVKNPTGLVCEKKELPVIDLDVNKCPIYGYRLYMHMNKLQVLAGTTGVLKSVTVGYNDRLLNCNNDYCQNQLAFNYEYCYDKATPSKLSAVLDIAPTTSSAPKTIDPSLVPYESNLGPNISNGSDKGFNKNTFSKIYFDNDKEKLPEKIAADIQCASNEGALKGFELKAREDVKWKFGSYYSFLYGCTKGDSNDLVDAASKPVTGTSGSLRLVSVTKKDNSGMIDAPIGNYCDCPSNTVMASLEFFNNESLKNNFALKCTCKPVKSGVPLKCEKKTTTEINLGFRCPVLGFVIYPKMKLSIFEGANRVLKSFTIGFNDATRNCEGQICTHLITYAYEFCYNPNVPVEVTKPAGAIPNPSSSMASSTSSSFGSSSTYSYTPSNSNYSYTPTTSTINKTSTTTLAPNTQMPQIPSFLNSLGYNNSSNQSTTTKTTLNTSSPLPAGTYTYNPLTGQYTFGAGTTLKNSPMVFGNSSSSSTSTLPKTTVPSTTTTTQPIFKPITSNIIVQPTIKPITTTTTITQPILKPSTTTTTPVSVQPEVTPVTQTTQPASGVSSSDKALIVKVHNELRNKMATQTTEFGTKFPLASNMRQVYWSEEIAKLAQEHADKKVFEHSTSTFRKTPTFSYIGENLATQSYYGGEAISNWDRAIRSWFSEIKDFNEDVSSYKTVGGPATGHFTQIVWAESYAIGCGLSSYPKNGGTTFLFVCQYGPGGNFLSKPIYLQGKRNCASGTTSSTDYPGLCCVANKCTANDYLL